MAKLEIWNCNQIILTDEGSYDDLESILDDFMRINEYSMEGGADHDFIIHTTDEYLMIRDNLVDKDDDFVGRFELRR